MGSTSVANLLCSKLSAFTCCTAFCKRVICRFISASALSVRSNSLSSRDILCNLWSTSNTCSRVKPCTRSRSPSIELTILSNDRVACRRCAGDSVSSELFSFLAVSIALSSYFGKLKPAQNGWRSKVNKLQKQNSCQRNYVEKVRDFSNLGTGFSSNC